MIILLSIAIAIVATLVGFGIREIMRRRNRLHTARFFDKYGVGLYRVSCTCGWKGGGKVDDRFGNTDPNTTISRSRAQQVVSEHNTMHRIEKEERDLLKHMRKTNDYDID